MNGDPYRPPIPKKSRMLREIERAVRDYKRAQGIPRKAYPKRKRSTPRRSERVRDTAFLAWMHETQGCWLADHDPTHVCSGPLEIDHVGRRPMGRKCSDHVVVIFCRDGHRARAEKTDYFAGRSFDWWERFRTEEPAIYVAKFLSHGGRRTA